MVEINNQRKAFLDMLAWSEGTDNEIRKPENHGYDVIVGGETIYWLLRSPSQTSRKPKTQINRRRTPQLLFPLVGCLPQAAAWKTSLRKVGTLYCSGSGSVALSRCMIDRGDVRQTIDRCNNIWASLPSAGYSQFEHKADSLIANSKKRAERSEIDVWAVTAIISALVICIIVCLSWAVNQCHW